MSPTDFRQQEANLRIELLALQRQLAAHDLAVVVLIAGVPGAGRSEVIHRLTEWLDPRGVETHAFWLTTDEDERHPWFWRFWQRLPATGRIGLLFGSWYAEPMLDRIEKRTSRSAFAERLAQINSFETLLADDRTIIVKIWLDLSPQQQRSGLRRQATRQRRPATDIKRLRKQYKRSMKVGERILAATDGPNRHWHRIPADSRHERDLSAGYQLRDALHGAINDRTQAPPVVEAPPPVTVPDHLAMVDLTPRIGQVPYASELRKLQKKLGRLSWEAHRRQISTILVLEGWDAAGKGGAIRRIMQAIDPRLCQVVPIAAPTDEEAGHHYLWRFWRHIPRDGNIVIFDRSWYGRLLVERIEGFAKPHEWQRAYWEIRQFELELADHGAIIDKFWLHISAEEQLTRFEERRETPWKAHKLTDEDWRNRNQRPDYLHAVNQMVEETSTPAAPWHLIAAEHKRQGRLAVLETLGESLEKRLSVR